MRLAQVAPQEQENGMMATKRLISRVLAGGLVGLLATMLPVSAAEPTAAQVEFLPKLTDTEVRLEQTLKTHVTLDFKETPLVEVANWFSSKLSVPVLLDNRTLEDAGIDHSLPRTLKVEFITARAALKLLLDEIELVYLIQDGYLLITTQDKADTVLLTRVYPVGDLLTVGDGSGMGSTRSAIVSGSTTVGNSSSGTYPPHEQSTRYPSSTQTTTKTIRDFDSLIEVITSTVTPQTWDEVGGPGSISPLNAADCIVISQTREVHDQVLELLRALRAAKRVGNPIQPAWQGVTSPRLVPLQ
jgi:general secretion pathway protein D